MRNYVIKVLQRFGLIRYYGPGKNDLVANCPTWEQYNMQQKLLEAKIDLLANGLGLRFTWNGNTQVLEAIKKVK